MPAVKPCRLKLSWLVAAGTGAEDTSCRAYDQRDRLLGLNRGGAVHGHRRRAALGQLDLSAWASLTSLRCERHRGGVAGERHRSGAGGLIHQRIERRRYGPDACGQLRRIGQLHRHLGRGGAQRVERQRLLRPAGGLPARR